MKTRTRTSPPRSELKTSRIIAIILLTAVALIAFTGCKSSKNAATVDPTGKYHLVSVDGKPVPCGLTHEGTAMTIHSGEFTINADNTCSSLMIFSVGQRTNINREVKATYTCSGAELTMRWERAGITKGTVDGKTFTMNNEGMVLAYEK